MFLTHLAVGVIIGLSVTQGNLLDGILHLSVLNDFQFLVNLAVSLVRVDNHVKVVIVAEHLGEHTAERLLEHADECGLVDVLEFLELGKLCGHVNRFFSFSHNLCSVFSSQFSVFS